MNNAGILIKQKRKEKKLTLQEVADKLEVSKATVSKWENNQIKNLKRSKLIALSNLLDLSPAELIDGIDYEVEQTITIQGFQTQINHLLYQTNGLNDSEKSLIKNYVSLICENKGD